MAPGSRTKRESTFGLPTPNQSMRASATPKIERDEVDFSSLSDSVEVATPDASFSGHDGLPSEYDGRSEHNRRSESVSIRTSRPPQQFARGRPMASSISPPTVQGFELVGKNVKILVDAINDLRKIKLKHIIQLPELILIGDQSAGKSSLMSALTGIQLPRAQGTCTRCPANITTSPANIWSCKISLQQTYNFNRASRGVSTSVTKNNMFGPWAEQEDMIVYDFNTIYDKGQLEENIKWAQVALLNPDKDHTLFVPGKGRLAAGVRGEYQNQARFTPNVIAVEISGPNLPTLSFFDLPGIIADSGEEDVDNLPKLVENLAKKYMKRENAIIIWTLAMKHDPQVSNTGGIIKTLKAAHRTIGVFTNPDHLTVRSAPHEQVLRGERFKMGHGWFVTRQPGEEVDVSGPNYHVEARQLEQNFFATNELWNGEWKDFLPRCGTDVIQEYLSLELARQIMKSIPIITRKIDTATREVQEQLDQCPDLPNSNVKIEITKRITRFALEIMNMISGNAGDSEFDESFKGAWSSIIDEFKAMLLHVKPKITLGHPSDTITQTSLFVDLTGDGDDDNGSRPASPVDNRKRRAPSTFQDSPPKRPNFLSSGNSTPDHRFKRENGGMAPPPRQSQSSNKFPDNPYGHLSRMGNNFMSIADISSIILHYSTPGINSFTPIEAYNAISLKTIIPWKPMLEVFMNELFTMVRRVVKARLEKHLGIYERRELFRAANHCLDQFLDQLEADQRLSLNEIFDLENYQEYTVNKKAHDDHKKSELEGLTGARRHARARSYLIKQWRSDPKKKPASLAELSGNEYQRQLNALAAAVKDKELEGEKTEKFAQELEVAAHARAYYFTAGMRFLDNVCLSVNGKMFRRILSELGDGMYLQLALGIDSEATCRDLMEEDDTVASRRAALKTEKEKLTGFANRLDQLVTQIESSQHTSEPSFTTSNSNFNASSFETNGESSRGNGYHAPSIVSEEDVDMEGVGTGTSEGTVGNGGGSGGRGAKGDYNLFPPMTAIDGGR